MGQDWRGVPRRKITFFSLVGFPYIELMATFPVEVRGERQGVHKCPTSTPPLLPGSQGGF